MLSKMVYLVFFLALVCRLLKAAETSSRTEAHLGSVYHLQRRPHLLQQQMNVQPSDRMRTTSTKLVRMTYRTLHSVRGAQPTGQRLVQSFT